jgi:O-antigen/teichoic acid export membrane protein
MIIENIKSLLKKEFFRDVAKLMTGTIIAQVITISFMPLLARLYTPEEFGLYALFFSLVSTLGFVSTGRYDSAIILPKDNESARRLLVISLLLCVIFSLLIGLILLVFPMTLWENIGLKGFSKIAVYFPFGIFATGIFQTLYSWHNRNKNYNLLSKNKVLQNTSVATINISGGYTHLSTGGLIWGYLTGQVISIISLLRNEYQNIIYQFKKFNPKNLYKEVIGYRNFPLFLAPMVFLNTISLNILVFLLTAYFNQSLVGLYSQAYKAISYPLYFITASFTPVFFQKLNETNRKLRFFVNSFISCLIIGIIALSPVVIWGQELFTFVFGKQWEFSGRIAAVLCPLTVASFAVNNVSSLFSVTQTNHILLIWQIIYLACSSAIIISMKNSEILTMLSWFSAFGTFMYLTLAFIGYKIIRKNNEKNH